MRVSRLVGLGTVLGAAIVGYVLTVHGALTVDLGVGRRFRPLGPLRLHISSDPVTVFDVIAAPYLGRTPRAMEGKLGVLERGSDMVLAAHFTPVSWGMTATTVETVQFQRPNVISFYLVRGPVPHVRETFRLDPAEGGTLFTYSGELGADLWTLGGWWAALVARPWERTVQKSMDGIKAEAERIAAAKGSSVPD
jgi:hypothetical protein